MGPTGAGKSQLAKRLCELKRAKHQITGPFVEVNCATIRGDAAMSTLFGHVKGAFTGAMKDRPGLLRSANGGILFLDEIGELGMDEQTMLLRALEEKRFLPLGSDQEVCSDFQLIAGTNRDLVAAVQQGHFREDLFARINLWTFRIPGLAERPEDLEPNLDFELNQYAQKNGMRITMNAEVRQRFLAFARSPAAKWKANFRDFNAAVTRMATLAPGGRITQDNLQEEINRLSLSWQTATSDFDPKQMLFPLLGSEKLNSFDLFDLMQLAQVIQRCRECSSLSEAGRILYSVSRGQKKQPNDADRLRKYLARFGLEWRDIL
jgi:transcriptional regulatory protein RtcR